MASYQGIDITPGTDAEVSKQIQAIDMGLSSKNLADTKGFNITPPTPSTKSQGLAGYIESSSDSFTKGLEAQAQQREQASSDSLQQYLDAVIGQKGEASLTSEAYATSGANTYQAELTDINNKILAEQHSLRRSIEALRKNPEGLYGGALQQEEQRITDESVARQADLAVLQLAKQGQFDSARQVAERAVAAKLEQQTNYLRALEINYSNNKDLFDKSEQRAFESTLADRNRELDLAAYKEKSRYDQILKQSDPSYQLDLQLKQAEVDKLNNPDPTGLSAETLERIQKLPVGSQEKLVNSTDTIQQLNRIKKLVAENDPITLSNPTTEAGRLFQRLATDVADKLARERTGAVVTQEESDNFKRILGLSFLNRELASSEEVNKELDYFISKHENVRRLIDPTGEIVQYMTGGNSVDSYLDSALGGSADPISAYLNSFYTPAQ